jgi:hypothetical protein
VEATKRARRCQRVQQYRTASCHNTHFRTLYAYMTIQAPLGIVTALFLLRQLASTNIALSMYMVKGPKQPEQMSNPSTYDQAMHDLMARPPYIKPHRVTFLRNLSIVRIFCTPTIFSILVAHTRIAYNAPPVKFNVVIKSIQSRLIRQS